MTENHEDIDWAAIDQEEQIEKPKRNYKRWAFRFFSYCLITEITVYLFTIARSPGLFDPLAYQKRLALFGLVILFTLIAAIFLLVLSYTNGEPPSLRRKVTLIGLITLVLYEAATRLLSILTYLT